MKKKCFIKFMIYLWSFWKVFKNLKDPSEIHLQKYAASKCGIFF